ncbi:MAG: hypothetical protein BJ554DRAFT_5641 [Olpidium bornovanus]|uniref:Large ribosomal subunit protein bL21m n=1 Tax=Olpidium bornovanus TaxID=278681 RepID=A0A8H8DKV7_9FUNG|nr:MAG: hypothetical protein BJ554DRAFT_5641 [Olpidium bornovanus]
MPPRLPAPLGRAAGTPAVRNAALPLSPPPPSAALPLSGSRLPPAEAGRSPADAETDREANPLSLFIPVRASNPPRVLTVAYRRPLYSATHRQHLAWRRRSAQQPLLSKVQPDFFENATRPRPVYDLPVPCLPQFRNEAGVRRGVWRLSDFKREEERLSRARSRNPSDEFSEQTKQAVAAVRNQNRYYAIIQIKGKSFLVTEGDTVTVPGLYEVAVGEVIDINRVREIGSRDFTIFGRDHVSPDYFDIKGTVIEKPRGKDVIVYRYLKGSFRKVKAQHHNFTTFRITKLDVNKLN